MIQKIAVKARNPGISRTDCIRPMPFHENPAASAAKLLISADQLANPSQLTKVSAIRNAVGEARRRASGEGRTGSAAIAMTVLSTVFSGRAAVAGPAP